MYCPDCGARNTDGVSFCSTCGAGLRHVSVGEVLQDRYQIEARIGGGGMGQVYRALDLRLECPCALKEMIPYGHSIDDRRVALQRFEQEAKVLRRLSHPGLPRVQDFFGENGRWFLVQDFIDGESLEEYLVRAGRPGLHEQEVTEVSVQVLDILHYLHTQTPPVLHRDVKPGNIMRTRDDGRIMLVDFGIARVAVKATGTSIGTLGYAPPEQYRGKAEARSDLYALGASMHHLLSGQAPEIPFHFEPIVTLAPAVTPRMRQVLDCALSSDVNRRFPSAKAMRDALLGLETGGAMARPTGVSRVTVPLRAPAPVLQRPSGQPSMVPPPTEPALPRMRASGSSGVGGLRPLGFNMCGYEEVENTADGSVLIRVPRGRFTMGSNERDDERPPHPVDVDEFWIARLPVTNLQFSRFVEATGHIPAGDWMSCARSWGLNASVAKVSWEDAMAYCKWAGLRLPTEAEWEYAARGTDGRRYPWGNTWDPTRCRHDMERLSRGAVAVGSFPEGASPCGCHEMAGNVWEWTASWYEPYARGWGRATEPQYRALRGGSWFLEDPMSFRCAARLPGRPDGCDGTWGFRCARDV